MKGYEVTSLTGIESVKGPGTLQWTPLRKHLGITAFGINAYTATEAGQDVVEEHNEERLGHEEIYVVVSGRATFVLDGDEVEVPAGSAVFLRDPKVKRYARAEEPGTTVLAVGGKPGSPRGLGLGVLLHRLCHCRGRPRRRDRRAQCGTGGEARPPRAALSPRLHQRPRGEARRGAKAARSRAGARSRAEEVGGRGRGPGSDSQLGVSRERGRRPPGLLRSRPGRTPCERPPRPRRARSSRR